MNIAKVVSMLQCFFPIVERCWTRAVCESKTFHGPVSFQSQQTGSRKVPWKDFKWPSFPSKVVPRFQIFDDLQFPILTGFFELLLISSFLLIGHRLQEWNIARTIGHDGNVAAKPLINPLFGDGLYMFIRSISGRIGDGLQLGELPHLSARYIPNYHPIMVG